MFATVGIYTFGNSTLTMKASQTLVPITRPVTGAQMISDLFIVFPCFEGADEEMMVRILARVCSAIVYRCPCL